MQKDKSKVVGQVNALEDEGGEVPAPPLCTNPDGTVTQCPDRVALRITLRSALPLGFSLLKKGLRKAAA